MSKLTVPGVFTSGLYDADDLSIPAQQPGLIAWNAYRNYIASTTLTLNANLTTYDGTSVLTYGTFSNGVYTVPASGTYFIALIVSLVNNSGTGQVIDFQIRKNGGALDSSTATTNCPNATWSTSSPDVIVSAVQGDTFSIGTYCGAVSSLACSCRYAFKGYRIG